MNRFMRNNNKKNATTRKHWQLWPDVYVHKVLYVYNHAWAQLLQRTKQVNYCNEVRGDVIKPPRKHLRTAIVIIK